MIQAWMMRNGVHGSALHGCQALIGRAVERARPEIAIGDRFAMQPVGRPVRRDVAAMAPYRAELLPARGEPGALAVANLLGRIEGLAGAGADGVRDGRCGEVDLSSQPAQCGEGKDEYDCQLYPQFAVLLHGGSSCGSVSIRCKSYAP